MTFSVQRSRELLIRAERFDYACTPAEAEDICAQHRAALEVIEAMRLALVESEQCMRGVNEANKDQANPARKCGLMTIARAKEALSLVEEPTTT